MPYTTSGLKGVITLHRINPKAWYFCEVSHYVKSFYQSCLNNESNETVIFPSISSVFPCLCQSDEAKTVN